ncbi:MAG: acyl-CoA dehydrogenase family protein [Pseudomonadales bacterium]
MNFGFTEEQNMLREQVRRFMQETLTMRRVRELMGSDSAFDPALWQQAGELGWLGLTIPEQHGGLGLKWVDLTVVLEETARGLSPLPIASQALAAAAIQRCGSEQHRTGWLPSLASGSAICTLALYDEPNWISPEAINLEGTAVDGGIVLSGTKPFVPDAAAAQDYLLAFRGPQGLALAALSRDQLEIRPQPIMDRSKPTGSVTLSGVEIPHERVLPMTTDDLAWLTDLGAVAVTAEMVGAAEAAVAMTSDYARTRIQFGRPIGQYQGVKHRLADMYVDVESFKSLLYYAAWTVDDAPAELPRAASLAKGYASDAFARIGIDGVGLHGAIGFTAEYDIQLYLKRSKWARSMFGDSDFHLDRVAALGGL